MDIMNDEIPDIDLPSLKGMPINLFSSFYNSLI